MTAQSQRTHATCLAGSNVPFCASSDRANNWGLLWGYRLLRAWHLHGNAPWQDMALLAQLNIGAEPVPDEQDNDKLMEWLEDRIKALEQASGEWQPVVAQDSPIRTLLNASGLDVELLALFATMVTHSFLGKVAESCVAPTPQSIVLLVAAALGRDTDKVWQSMKPGSFLNRSRLVSIDYFASGSLLRKVDTLAGLPDLVYGGADADIRDKVLAERFLRRVDFPADGLLATRAWQPMLDKARALIQRHQAGQPTHVLLYGETGTGRTRFAQLLARHCDMTLYVLGSHDQNAEFRRKSYCIADGLLSQQPDSLVLVDVGASVLHCPSGSEAVRENLLQAQRPAIWVAGNINNVNPRLLDQFACAFAFSAPDKPARKEWVAYFGKDLALSKATRNALGAQPDLRPADLAAATRVARYEPDGDKREQAFRDCISDRLALRGVNHSFAEDSPLQLTYLPQMLQTRPRIDQVADRLARIGKARICLYGPSGTGKSAYARHLAQRMDRPLHVKQASDLLSPYVGETEERIAKAFFRAQQEQAILLMDEVDSYLANRKGLSANWEATQVNQLLTQMESFDGIFLCTTNRQDSLDEACVRRFDLMVEFSPLETGNAWTLFSECCDRLEVAADEACRAPLARLDGLTPGDFQTCLNRFGLLGKPETAAELLQALGGQVALKQPGRPFLGFTGAATPLH